MADVKLPHDIETIILPPPFPWLYVVVALVIIGVVVLLLWWWLKRHRKQELKPVDFITSMLAEVTRLETALSNDPDVKKLSLETAAFLRLYAEHAGLRRATSMTSQELVPRLEEAPALVKDDRDVIATLLKHCDLVLYAGMPFDSDAFASSLQAMRRMIILRQASNLNEVAKDV